MSDLPYDVCPKCGVEGRACLDMRCPMQSEPEYEPTSAQFDSVVAFLDRHDYHVQKGYGDRAEPAYIGGHTLEELSRMYRSVSSSRGGEPSGLPE